MSRSAVVRCRRIHANGEISCQTRERGGGGAAQGESAFSQDTNAESDQDPGERGISRVIVVEMLSDPGFAAVKGKRHRAAVRS
jgi:hypothetical protein